MNITIMKNIGWKCFLLAVGFFADRTAAKEVESFYLLRENVHRCNQDQHNFPTPRIVVPRDETFLGGNFTLNCKVDTSTAPHNTLNTSIIWDYPRNVPNNQIPTVNNVGNSTVWMSLLTVTNTSGNHAGNYTCLVKNRCGQKSASTLISPREPKLKLKKISNIKDNSPYKTKDISFFVNIINSEPEVTNVTFFKNDVPIESLANSEHYQTQYKNDKLKAVVTIINSTVEDTANYTITVTNGYLTKSETFDIRKAGAPEVHLGSNNVSCVIDTNPTYQCKVTGYPLPRVIWLYNNTVLTSKDITKRTRIEVKSLYEEIAYLDADNCDDVNLTCSAENGFIGESNMSQDTKHISVYEVKNGFGVLQENNESDAKDIRFIEYRDAKIECLASVYKFKNVTWVTNQTDLAQTVKYSSTKYSLVTELNIKNIRLAHEGRYLCKGILNGTYETYYSYINVKVLARKAPTLVLKHTDQEKLFLNQSVFISCKAQGVPRPKIEWFKDDKNITNTMNSIEISEAVDYMAINSTAYIKSIKEENVGTYRCTATSESGEVSESYNLAIEGTPPVKYYIIVICIIVTLFSILLAFLRWKMKERKRRFLEDLHAAGLYRFIEGDIPSLNPELRIDEGQGHLLPYDTRFEFPAGRLKFGVTLGSGAFGVVKMATAQGIINAEETTIVAVKMVEKTADNMHIKALASELKVMIHLGKHLNIVNVLGACTENIRKRELLVIVEYCIHGNIHKYIQNHRDVFINESLYNHDVVENGIMNIAYSENPRNPYQNSNSIYQQMKDLISGNLKQQTQTDQGYVLPDWRTNYESDYSCKGRAKRPLTPRDLLCWAFQIARGMEYLAKRRICHRDLAARNVLLSEDNIVKICDFGLSKSLYMNDEYRRNADSQTPLPVKWLAIECMTESVFTTQSDVWSFGVLLWELFSLARVPYPAVSPVDLLKYLLQGNRLDKPPHADDRMYDLMKRCWERKPTERPSFTDLQEILGSFLENSVRNHIAELGAIYADGFSSAPVEDYLEMVRPPDYTSVTSSPHDDVNNQNIVPASPKYDDQVRYQDPVSPEGKDVTKSFTIDARSFNTQTSRDEDTEQTPMIALGSFSINVPDPEEEQPCLDGISELPYFDEKVDDVLHTKQESSVVESFMFLPNPMYMAFEDLKVEKM